MHFIFSFLHWGEVSPSTWTQLQNRNDYSTSMATQQLRDRAHIEHRHASEYVLWLGHFWFCLQWLMQGCVLMPLLEQNGYVEA